MQHFETSWPDGHWMALSDHVGSIDPASVADLVQAGALIVEFTRPKDQGSVLLDFRSEVGWPRAFSIFHHTETGVSILHRQGEGVQRHHLPGPLRCDGDLTRLTYTWNGPARIWSMSLEDTAGTWVHRAAGSNPMPLAGADLLALCAGSNGTRKDMSVQWFGVCKKPPHIATPTWIGHRTPVETARGRVAAGDLRPGDQILTLDNGPRSLQALRRMTLPNRGRFAPVLLRAPYFARQTDVLVAQGQLMLLSGGAVEYLFGEDAVLAPAAALRDGNSALSDVRRPLTSGIALDLGGPCLIVADGLPLLCSHDPSAAPMPYRLLHDYEALPLRSSMGRYGRRNAA